MGGTSRVTFGMQAPAKEKMKVAIIVLQKASYSLYKLGRSKDNQNTLTIVNFSNHNGHLILNLIFNSKENHQNL